MLALTANKFFGDVKLKRELQDEQHQYLRFVLALSATEPSDLALGLVWNNDD